jgi:hypothetical protein
MVISNTCFFAALYLPLDGGRMFEGGGEEEDE